MPIPRLVARSLIVVVVALGGCTFYDSGPMSVDVRDARTMEPVADAVVVVRSLHLYQPAWPHDVRFPPDVETQRGVTDADGMCRFDVVSYPARIYVYHLSHTPQHFDFEGLPTESRETADWQAAMTSGTHGDVDGTLHVRLSATRLPDR